MQATQSSVRVGRMTGGESDLWRQLVVWAASACFVALVFAALQQVATSMAESSNSSTATSSQLVMQPPLQAVVLSTPAAATVSTQQKEGTTMQVSRSLTVNGKQVNVPDNGTVQQTVQGDSGSSQVRVSTSTDSHTSSTLMTVTSTSGSASSQSVEMRQETSQ